MPDVKPEKWDSTLDRDDDPVSDATVLCAMYDAPVAPLNDPVINPPEEEA